MIFSSTTPKAIIHEGQRSCKFLYLYSSFVYSVSDEAVYCTESTAFIFGEAKVLWFFCQQGIKGLP